jgi:hypothetical protein
MEWTMTTPDGYRRATGQTPPRPLSFEGLGRRVAEKIVAARPKPKVRSYRPAEYRSEAQRTIDSYEIREYDPD